MCVCSFTFDFNISPQRPRPVSRSPRSGGHHHTHHRRTPITSKKYRLLGEGRGGKRGKRHFSEQQYGTYNTFRRRKLHNTTVMNVFRSGSYLSGMPASNHLRPTSSSRRYMIYDSTIKHRPSGWMAVVSKSMISNRGSHISYGSVTIRRCLTKLNPLTGRDKKMQRQRARKRETKRSRVR